MVSRVRAADARGRDEAVRCSPAHDMRRRSGRLQGRLERLAVLRWVTDPKDIRPNESSWPACLSLQTLLNLNQGSPVPATNGRSTCGSCSAFGLDGLQSQDALAGTLTQPRTRTYEVAEVFERLEHEELIATAGSRWSRSSSGPRYRRR
jgi:hypothetical protein